MGKGVCSRRQRKIFQSFLLITVICGSMYAFMISYEMHKQLKKTEAMALKYQQHQESLSAQLQVVYEHRSRLEKSLQKERMEHKKAKDDHLAYKLETEQLLNEEKESNNRLNALQAQHQILKSQHEDLKKQYYELQEQHQNQGENHERVLDEHREQLDHLQRTKEMEVSRLKENVYNLKEENRQLRKAHQDIRTQLLDVRQQHKDLRIANDELKQTVEDHQSALAVAKVEELQHLKGQSPNTTQAVIHSLKAYLPHTQSHGLGVPETKPNSLHTQPGHTITSTHNLVASNKEKVESVVSRHIIPDVEVKKDEKQIAGQKQVQIVPAEEEAKEEKGESRGKTSFQRWRSRLEHRNVLDGDPGKKILSSHEEQDRKDGLNRQKRQPEILNPDIVLEDLRTHHKDRAEVEDIRIHGKNLKEEVQNPAEDPNNPGEDEFEEAEQQEQQQQGELVRAEPAAHQPAGSQERVAQEEQLVMAGSPDHQEDNLDDQYEEAEEEAGDDRLEKEEEGGIEDPYSEENAEQGPWNEDIQDNEDRDHIKEEEEVELVEENEGPKEIHTNIRAEM